MASVIPPKPGFWERTWGRIIGRLGADAKKSVSAATVASEAAAPVASAPKKPQVVQVKKGSSGAGRFISNVGFVWKKFLEVRQYVIDNTLEFRQRQLEQQRKQQKTNTGVPVISTQTSPPLFNPVADAKAAAQEVLVKNVDMSGIVRKQPVAAKKELSAYDITIGPEFRASAAEYVQKANKAHKSGLIGERNANYDMAAIALREALAKTSNKADAEKIRAQIVQAEALALPLTPDKKYQTELDRIEREKMLKILAEIPLPLV